LGAAVVDDATVVPDGPAQIETFKDSAGGTVDDVQLLPMLGAAAAITNNMAGQLVVLALPHTYSSLAPRLCLLA
jgi:hypothetical protein